MGLFGFGKKKHQSEEALEAAAEENEEAVDAAENVDEAQEVVALPESSAEYEGRGDERGPWDVEDENVPDYDEYLDMGSYYLPFLRGIELRVKANRATQQVLGTTITYGSSSVEIEAFAAPKTLGLWDDVRADLIEANKDAKEVEGVFGTELALPVTVKGGRKVLTRIVGVDGPRWMLRGIFSGKAATDPEGEEAKALNQFFADIVVERGDDPLAPRDLIPMHPPVAPAERKAAKAAAEEAEQKTEIPGKPKGPFDSDQQVEVKTTLSRGPMFSEVR
ncbi:DUF3710 domain-containing protein [Bifidobacterium catenulatum]|uniref:DUF3710 domain-containing protein n=1 Tax=Bifidobacterium catenulatum subsp. kashiwanohense TaxID=630129 RepID=A0AA43P7Z1_9BIFI|nr:DUF3710 domain-containing protein [Bifidobacterium catenulatum]KFI67266.1 hypothetical protein BKAS_0557 [Bifidobacterium catenulatum subsp. kashiwanohense JCM 15439 = DSM 21854]MDH7881638.1 DUF3710 domain-containing protein [Bifidobacterium catenulatum subsp. kashiwanohense]MDH7890573.1 DUF3710 domain-containing protein [Bifidobacterium catenulatum subsp. kashiwanohense]QGM63034.1 hypothetical protein BKKJ1_1520 [Bifidobacterium catenulatum subsp. kashiwanohense]BAQ29493.1 conserved hypoth